MRRPPESPGERDPLEGQELELTYPCSWSYTLVCEEEGALRAAVSATVGELEHTLTPSRRSSGGRYLSFHLDVVVASDGQRLELFRCFHEHPDVRYVL